MASLTPSTASGEREPLILLHGVSGSGGMWRHVVPLLSDDFEVIAPTALGHRGGHRVDRHPVSLTDVVDDFETVIDGLGWETAHLVGNSMGGYAAAQLARRGRARSLCLFSPAGCWDPHDRSFTTGRDRLRRVARDTRRSRPLLPVLARASAVRRFALRDNAVHGDRVTAAELVDLADDLLGCTALDDLLASNECLPSMADLDVPALLAWPERDRILPFDVEGARARRLLPTAEFRALSGVGHVPMFDDPRLVADVIRSVAGRT